MKNNAQKDYAKKVEIQEQMNRVMAELADSYNQKNNVDNPANVLKLQKLKRSWAIDSKEIEGNARAKR